MNVTFINTEFLCCFLKTSIYVLAVIYRFWFQKLWVNSFPIFSTFLPWYLGVYTMVTSSTKPCVFFLKLSCTTDTSEYVMYLLTAAWGHWHCRICSWQRNEDEKYKSTCPIHPQGGGINLGNGKWTEDLGCGFPQNTVYTLLGVFNDCLETVWVSGMPLAVFLSTGK